MKTRHVMKPLAAIAVAVITVGNSGGSSFAAGEKAGVAGAVRGSVKQVAFNKASSVGRAVASKDPIRLGDRIVTGSKSGLQILLLDQTVFTIGPNASMVIDQFIYDPSKAGGQVGASISKGVFRFVSGKIARRNPAGFKLKLPVATLSVRGTTGIGVVGPNSATIVLVGPGPKNNTNDVPSRLIVSASGKTVVIYRPSWGVVISGLKGTPTAPRYFSPVEIQKIVGALRLRPPVQRGSVGDPLQAVNPASGQSATMPYGIIRLTDQQMFQQPPGLGGLTVQSGGGGATGGGGGGGASGGGGGGGAGGGGAGGVPPRVGCALPPQARGGGGAFGRCN